MSADDLKKYKEKRDFTQTSEPKGDEKVEKRKSHQFVIQQHDASTIHYDFRIQVGDTFASWAVPKGPSTDPSEKRLAVRTENHPLSYGNFEGTIAEGNYGAGTVLLWDRGQFENLRASKESEQKNMEDSLEDGKIEVWLHGEKLQGGYVLIRTSGGDNEQWLLKKMKDEEADARRNPTSTESKSVQSGLTIDEIPEKENNQDD